MHQNAFISFLEALETPDNSHVIQTIHQGYSIMLEAMSVEEKYDKFWKNIIPEDNFKKVVEADPTKKKAFTKWMVEKLYKNNQLKMEDLYKATNYLKLFAMYKNHLPKNQQNLMSYNSLPELYKIIEPFKPEEETEETDKTAKLDKEKVFLSKGEAEKFYEDDTWKVIIPKTLEASCFFGKGTEWCTLHENMFKNYSSQGPLYININKKANRKYQFHFESDQFMDEDDDEISITEIGLTPKLFDIYLNKFDFKKEPLSTIHHFPPKNRMEIVNKFPQSFSEVFKKEPSTIVYFPPKNQIEIVNKFPQSFSEVFKNNPDAIHHFLPKNRMEIVNKFPQSFAEGFKKDTSAIFWFPKENQIEIVNKFPQSFAEGFKKDTSAIQWLHKENQMEIKKRFNL